MPKKEEKGAGATSGGAQWRKLKPIIDDLTRICREYGKDEKELKEMEGMDAFDKAKRRLNEDVLPEIKKAIDQINDMKRGLPEGDRDVNLIKLQSDTRKKLTEASQTWGEMKKALDKELKKGEKSKVPRDKLEARGQMLSLIGNEIMDFNNRLSTVKEVKSTVELGVVAARRADRKAKKGRRGRRGRGGDEEEPTDGGDEPNGGGDNGDEFDDVAPPSEQQLAFMQRKDDAYAEQDELLDMISKGMDDLKQMGLAINKELKLQDQILDKVDEQMTHVTEKIKSQNEKMQELIDANGGAARWCPLLICAVILLALLGYIFKML